MGCHGNHAFQHSQNKFCLGDHFFRHARGPNEQFDTHGILSWGSKVGQISYQGTCNVILFSDFQRFLHFSYFFTPEKYHFPPDFWTFSL